MSIPRITKEDLKQRLDDVSRERPVIVDVRLKYPYEHSTATLPGAIRMPPDTLDPSSLPRDREIVLYDSDPQELVSARAAAELIERGYRAVALTGGIGEWITAKFPTDPKTSAPPAPPAPGALKG
jgi:rhodanese-related sulfurtransferase